MRDLCVEGTRRFAGFDGDAQKHRFQCPELEYHGAGFRRSGGGAFGITENQILLLQTNSRTSRISTAPETLFDNPVHKGVSQGSDGVSEAGDNVGDLNNEFKRMFNPLYIIECH